MYISDYAFTGCKRLKITTEGKALGSGNLYIFIGSHAFDSEVVRTIAFTGYVDLSNSAFADCPNLNTVLLLPLSAISAYMGENVFANESDIDIYANSNFSFEGYSYLYTTIPFDNSAQNPFSDGMEFISGDFLCRVTSAADYEADVIAYLGSGAIPASPAYVYFAEQYFGNSSNYNKFTANDKIVRPEPTPEPEPEPTPTPSYTPSYTPPVTTPAPTPTTEVNPYVLPGVEVEQTAEGTQYTTASGVTSTVKETPEGVKVEAGVNESGSVNSQATAAAVSEAAQIAKENGETSVEIDLPIGTVGLSKSTVQKLLDAAGDTEVVINVPTVVDGETVGSISVPLTEESGQILTGINFNTKNIQTVQNYIARKWKSDILGSFETAQKGGWGDFATLSISIDKLGFSAEDGTKLYALIYDTKAKKWYQVEATIEDGNVVIKTKRSGIITIVTNSVK
jgi:hypothetical protein